MKKKWDKPKLIVLVRAGSEEGVLKDCKFPPPGGETGPSAAEFACMQSAYPSCTDECSGAWWS